MNSNSKPFATRSVFASILPQEFTLGDIFDEFIEEDNLEENKRNNEPDQQRKFINTKWRLSYIICYNKQHYIALVRSQKCWYICEDLETNLCGNFDDLFGYLETRKLIPYLVFYQTWDDEENETLRYQPEYDPKNSKFAIENMQANREVIDDRKIEKIVDRFKDQRKDNIRGKEESINRMIWFREDSKDDQIEFENINNNKRK